MIAEFECLEPKASRMHFGHGRDKCNDGTLQQFFILLVRLKCGVFLFHLQERFDFCVLYFKNVYYVDKLFVS